MTATDGAREQGTGSLGGSPVPVTGLRWRRVFPGEERQLGVLRRWLALLLPDCPSRDDVTCVATELGTNAVRHTASGRGGWFAAEITWHRAVVRVAVADGGAPGGPQVIGDPDGEHGRGLLVVAGLSARTGVCGDHRGRLVWADVAWDDTGTVEPASSRDRHEAAIRDGQARLASRFAGVPVWFGWSTLLWWALAGGELVAAASAEELASLLRRIVGPASSWPPGTADMASADAQVTGISGRDQRPGIPMPWSKRGCGHLPRGGCDELESAAWDSGRGRWPGERAGQSPVSAAVTARS
jgi:serine/threonine-protein kinase RsbW